MKKLTSWWKSLSRELKSDSVLMVFAICIGTGLAVRGTGPQPVEVTIEESEPVRVSAVSVSGYVIPVSDSLEWEGIVVHHSGATNDTVLSIDAWHREKGWDGIGYHFVIHPDGEILPGRSLAKHGAHAKTGKPHSRNKTHIGICLIGTDTFSIEQKQSLDILVGALGSRFKIDTIEEHHDKCPGAGIDLDRLEVALSRSL